MEPLARIPQNLIKEFTMDGKIGVLYWYFNEAYSPKKPKVYTRKTVEKFLEKIKRKECNYYGQTDMWLYEAISKHGIKNKTVGVIGSTLPWYESICLHYGAKKVVTVEYNKIISEHLLIITLTPSEYEKNPIKFDAALSISSFEHDGLGRYGDPINPNGDLEAMEKMKKMIKSGGLLFLAVQTGKDKLVWNAHRIYGKVRLPLLLKGWKIVDSFGYDEKLLNKDMGLGWINDWQKKGLEYPAYQPIFVLKNI